MPVDMELVHFATADGGILHGLHFRPRDEASDLALVTLHGVSGTFYTGFLPPLAKELAGRGYHVMTMNTRGHDWVTRGTNEGFWGAAHENFDDCLLDVDAALAYLSGRGYRRFVIVGHSLGGVKVVYYQGNRQRTDVLGVVSYSAPIIAFPDRLERAPDSLKTLQEAEALVEAGRGEEYITEEDTGAVRRFTARTFLSKYGRHGKTDVRPLAAHIGGPLLATAGGLEVDTFATHARQLAEAAGPDRGNWHVVEGADHFYAGHLPELVELTVPWLNRVTKAPVASS